MLHHSFPYVALSAGYPWFVAVFLDVMIVSDNTNTNENTASSSDSVYRVSRRNILGVEENKRSIWFYSADKGVQQLPLILVILNPYGPES